MVLVGHLGSLDYHVRSHPLVDRRRLVIRLRPKSMSWERRDLLLVVEASPISFHLLPLWFFLSKDLLFKVLDHAHELMVLLLCACE